MAKLYGEIAKSALLTLDKSFSRALGQPLDASEVYYSLAAAEAYAKTSAAYVGQKIVVIEEGKVTHYSVENADGLLKEVGVRPTGDGKSITVTAEGVVSILGVDAAESLTLPRMKEDKSGIEWVPVSAVVQGDGNDNTTYTFELNEAGTGIVITTKFNGTEVEGGRVTIDLDVYTKKEVDDKFDAVDEKFGDLGGKSVVELIAAEAKRAEDAEKALGERIDGIDYIDADELAEALEPYATTEYVDGEIDKIEDAISKLNHFTAKVVESIDDVKEVGVLYLIKDASVTGVDKYNEYIVVDGAPVLIGDTTTDLSNYYNKTDIDGKVEALEGAIEDVDSALGEYKEEVAGKYATTDSLNEYKEEVDGKYATIDALNGVKETAEAAQTAEEVGAAISGALESYYNKNDVDGIVAGYYNKGEVDGIVAGYYNKGEVDGIIADYHTKEEVNGLLAGYHTKEEVNELIEGVEGQIVTDLDKMGGYEDLVKSINDAAALGQQGIDDAADALGAAQTAQGAAEAAQGAAEAAQGTADEALSKAGVNAGAISGLDTRLGTVEGLVGGHTTELSGLTGRVNVLEGEDVKINEALGTINGEITALKGEDGRLAGLIAANTEELNKKALATDVTAINEKIGAVGDTADKNTVYGAIAKAQAAATYDDTAVRQLIADEAARADAEEKRIVGLVEAEAARADAAEKVNAQAVLDEKAAREDAIAVVEAAIKTETGRAQAAEEANRALINGLDAAVKANTEEITRVDNVLKAALENDGEGLDSIKELADWINKHGTDAANMTKAIEKNATDIANIYIPASGDEKASGVLVDEVARIDGVLDGHKTAIEVTLPAAIAKVLEDAKKDAADKAAVVLGEAQKYADDQDAITLAAANKYTDDTMVKADGVTIENKNGTFGVKEISTDLLVQGEVELILNGGNAALN